MKQLRMNKHTQMPEMKEKKFFLQKYLRVKNIIPALIISGFGYLAFLSSCANIGTPTGGPKDTISPVVVNTIPDLRGTNYSGEDIRLTFNEYVVYDDLSQKLVISPPMKKKPIFKSKGKTLIVEFKEPLRDSTTYSLDFKDAVADNNEKNPCKNLRFAFSTGPYIDTLQVGGFVKDAMTLEPVDEALVLLHRDLNNEAFYDSVPSYIGKTDKEGYFEIKNIAPGKYHLFALTDTDNSLTYNQSSEKIAFCDSLIVPSAKFVAEKDTIIKGNDTLVVDGKVKFFPGIQYLMMFQEETFDQYMKTYKRIAANKCIMSFAESLSDSFAINLIKPKPTKDWLFIESDLKRDSLTLWLTDTIVSNVDTLMMDVKYTIKDSLDRFVEKHDTLEMVYAKPKVETKGRKKKKEKVEIPQITLNQNIQSKGFDIYQNIELEAPEPLASFDTSMVHLYHVVDTLEEKIPIKVESDSMSIRKFIIRHHWTPEDTYKLVIDSAAAKTIYGYPSTKIDQRFQIQEERYYGQIKLDINNLTKPAIVQLLDNSKDEKVLQKIQLLEDGQVTFPYLKPEKYKIRLIVDQNKNGKWDTGYLAEKLQPERVIYFHKILKIKSNFDFEETWELYLDPKYKKELIDEAQIKEDLRKKKANKGNEDQQHSEQQGSTNRGSGRMTHE